MATWLLLIVAGLANAVMDITTHKFDESIFHKLNRYYWDPNASWVSKYENPSEKNGYRLVRKRFLGVPIPVVFTDSWHLFKSVMLWGIVVALVAYEPVGIYFLYEFTDCQDIPFWGFIIDVLLARSCFGLGFVLGYDYLFLNENGRTK